MVNYLTFCGNIFRYTRIPHPAFGSIFIFVPAPDVPVDKIGVPYKLTFRFKYLPFDQHVLLHSISKVLFETIVKILA